MKKIISSVGLLLITTIVSAQQLGDGYAPIITDFNVPLKSGSYSGLDVTAGATPDPYGWQHFLAIRQGNPNNNCQLQIASSFLENDRLFFRKIFIGSVTIPVNPSWVEIATRGNNTFIGDQNVNGNLDIFNHTNKIIGFGDKANYYIGSFPVTGSAGLDIHYHGGIRFGDYTSNSVMQITDGKVGIGTINPQNKLDVKGTIRSQEVKVTLEGWSDFVFKKEYDLPTLAEVEKHIKEKGHLENIPNEEEVLKNGINLGEMNAKLLQKIEELTLYMIDMKKENDQMKNKQVEFEKTINELRNKSK